MGGPNKLLAEIEGMPMVRRVVAAVCAAKLSQIVVVTGHEQEKVQSALQGLPLRFVHNPAFAKGLSTSLKTGIRSLVETVDAALVCLGDMPALSPTLITRLIAAFRPGSDGDIVVPVREGQRGNPVLIGRRHFASLLRLTGDVGAREVIRKRAKAVIEIEVDDDGAFLDLDTPQALAEYRAGSAGSSRGSQ
jgi:molybdenum cofactor cytidylyltransferase